MTTEPMLLVTSVVCQECGTEFSAEVSPGWDWYALPASKVRQLAEEPSWCDDDTGRGCGKQTPSLTATVPA